MKALVVDDDLSICEIIQKFLEPYGKCDIAGNGDEGVEAIRKAIDHGYPYDLICLDIRMPDINGHEVLKAIRIMEEKKGYAGIDHAKVIMVSGFGDYRDIMDAYQEQCDAYIQKPVQRTQFLEEVAHLGLINKKEIQEDIS